MPQASMQNLNTFKILPPAEFATILGHIFQPLRREGFMQRTFVAAAAVAFGALLNGALVYAHHSVAANFDQTRSIDVVGKVKEIAIRNPHSQITLQVKKPGGGTTEFFVEWSDKNALMRRTVPVSKLHIGDVVTVTVSPSKRLDNLGYFISAKLPDGTVLKDCGFAAFRAGIADGKSGCDESKR
jgi:hypothetical protein